MSSNRGVFAVSRDVFDHPSFQKEPFTECQAWIWLLAQAAWKPRRVRAVSGRAVEMVDLHRGQLCASLRFMQEAWRWDSVKRVRTFLKRLKTDTMIDTQTDALQTVITICNYDAFQFQATPEDTQADTQTGTTRARQGHKSKKDNNKKEESIGRSFGFEEWYALWPRKRQPDAARRVYKRVIASGRISHADLVTKTKAFVAEWNRSKQDLKFCPYPAKWLSDGGFDDEVATDGGFSSTTPTRDPSTFTDAEWQQRLANFKANGAWSSIWGSAPGKPGCLVPRHLLVVSAAGAA
jgi:hypothetical protein